MHQDARREEARLLRRTLAALTPVLRTGLPETARAALAPLLAPVQRACERLTGTPARLPAGAAERVLHEARQFYVAIDEDSVVLAWNRAAEELFGYPREQALGRTVDQLIVPASSRAAHHGGIEHYRRTGHGRGLDGPVEVEARRADGTTVPVELALWAEQTPAGPVFHALGHDLTRRRRDEQVLSVLAAHREGLLRSESPAAARHQLCRTVREAVQCQGVYLYEPTDRALRLPLRLTAESVHLAEHGQAEVVLPDGLADVLASPEGHGVDLGLAQLGHGAAAQALRATGLQTFAVRPLHRDGALSGVLLLGWLAADRRTRPADEQLLVLLVSEAALVFERLAVQEELRLAARTDPLTGLWNRRDLDERLAAAAGDDAPASLVLLDLDGFKAYNDAEGHPAGDALLARAASAWREALAGEGRLARTGGDEFAVLLVGSDLAAAREVGARLRAATPPPVGVTVGVAERRPGESVPDLVARADADLYAGKRRRVTPA